MNTATIKKKVENRPQLKFFFLNCSFSYIENIYIYRRFADFVHIISNGSTNDINNAISLVCISLVFGCFIEFVISNIDSVCLYKTKKKSRFGTESKAYSGFVFFSSLSSLSLSLLLILFFFSFVSEWREGALFYF